MKGLLLKDFYQLLRLFKLYFIVAAVFLALIAIGGENFFAIVYLSAVGGVIPMTLLAYDEQSTWDIYAQTLPYTRAQLVSVKYLMGLAFNGIVLVALTLIMLFGEYNLGNIMLSNSTILIFSTLVTALTAPLSFKFGTTKGKMIYGAILGAMVAISAAVLGIMNAWGFWIGTDSLLMAVGTAMIIYLLSWLLSVRFYRKRQF